MIRKILEDIKFNFDYYIIKLCFISISIGMTILSIYYIIKLITL